jgi:hypothetical protein
LDREAWLKLEEHGFVRDPFNPEAVRAEADTLITLIDDPDAFVEFPYFNSIKGTPQSPGPRFIFGGRGGGKTALRLDLFQTFEEEISTKVEDPILAVVYNNFDTVLELAQHDVTKVRLRYHVEYIVALIVQRLFWLMVDKEYKVKLSRLEDKHKRLFVWYAENFGVFQQWQLDYLKGKVEGLENFLSRDNVVNVGKGVLQLVADMTSPLASQMAGLFNELIEIDKPIKIQPQDIPLGDLLEGILWICKELGYEAVYVLVDDVDEPQYYGEQQDFSPAFELIRVLAASPKILGIRGLIFKFFLPIEIREQCLKSLRLDKFSEQIITWKFRDLKRLLVRRLGVASNGNVSSMSSLCDKEFEDDIDELLVDFAKELGNPRALVYLGNELLSEHFRKLRDVDDKITRATWSRARQRAEEVLIW